MANSGSSHQEILKAYQSTQLGNANEAATRLKVIDRILKEVLGWVDDDITPEERVSEDGKTTFADYVLKTANTAIVIEAKKAGANFSVPKSTRKSKLNSTLVAGELGDAIIQARDYARKLSIDFAAVTNGAVWVIFPAQRHDQVKFSESYALIFPSLESILQDDFQEFNDLLSRNSVIDGALELGLIGRNENQLESRKLGQAFTPNYRAFGRNPIFSLIEDAVRTAFSDSIGELDGELLEKCYVSTPDSLKFDSRINLHISKRESLFQTAATRPMKSSEANYLKERLSQSAARVKPLAILLLGTVGSGKTTFLHYTKKVKAWELFVKSKDKPYAHWVYIDFRDCENPSRGVEFIYTNLKNYIINDDYFSDFHRCIEKAYKNEIEALKKGPLFLIAKDEDKLNQAVTELLKNDYEKTSPYVDRLFTHAAKECAVFVAIDNVDQIEDEDEQSKLFGETIALGHKLGINLIMAMRGATYARHKNSPTFDAFDFDPLQIDPPLISSVLSKRFALTKQLLEGNKGEFLAENGAIVKLDNVARIIDIVQSSVLGTEIGNRIEVLAAEDVRLALRMTREFLEFGYSNFGKAWEIHHKGEQYVLPKHEAFRAILLGNRRVYSEEYSPIGNPFDARLSINSTQLLRLYILTAVVNFASSQTFRHIDGTAIADALRRIGFGDSLILRVLQDLCKFRFLHTASHNQPNIHSSFLPSRLGGYIVRDLIAYFPFLENVLFDTYIPDTNVWNKLRELSHKVDAERDRVKRVDLRVDRVRTFLSYLNDLFLPLQQESQKRGLSPEWCANPFNDTKMKLDLELKRVSSSVRKNYDPHHNDYQGEV